MIAPKLERGSTIGLCSPSSKPTPESMRRFIKGMQRMGFNVIEADNLYKDTDGYLPTIEERAADFNQMIYDDRVDLIFFSGGEGGPELLPHLDYDYLKKHPKAVLSYSDSTTLLNAIWSKTGLTTYYGHTPNLFGDLRQYDWEHFVTHLMEGPAEKHFANSEWHVMNPGVAQGVLVGGYSRNMAMLMNSEYFQYNPE